MKRLAAVALFFVTGTACSPFGYGEEAFYEKLGRVSCEKAFECDLQNASETWFNQGNCEDAYNAQAAVWLDTYAACKYSRRKAKKYVKTYKRLDCIATQADWAELDQLWGEVYECSGSLGGDTSETGTRSNGDTGDTGL